MPDDRKEKIDCGMLMKMISDQVQNDLNRELNEVNLTLSQFHYMAYIKEHGPQPVCFKDMERFFQSSQPTVSGILRRLDEKGLIRTMSAGRGRARMAQLTEEGERLVQNSEINRKMEEERLLGALNAEEREMFRSMLSRINEYLAGSKK